MPPIPNIAELVVILMLVGFIVSPEIIRAIARRAQAAREAQKAKKENHGT